LNGPRGPADRVTEPDRSTDRDVLERGEVIEWSACRPGCTAGCPSVIHSTDSPPAPLRRRGDRTCVDVCRQWPGGPARLTGFDTSVQNSAVRSSLDRARIGYPEHADARTSGGFPWCCVSISLQRLLIEGDRESIRATSPAGRSSVSTRWDRLGCRGWSSAVTCFPHFSITASRDPACGQPSRDTSQPADSDARCARQSGLDRVPRTL
jgi:hypothetical protein